jgi:glycosyltransferase involved in cell wall biosynthesis
VKVLFLTTHINAGGITSYLLTLVKGLAARGVRVHVASCGGDMETEFIATGAKWVTLSIRTKSELDYRIYQALAPLRAYVLKEQIDIIHAQTRVTQVMGAVLGKITRRPYVSTCHGFFKTRLSRRLLPCWGRRVIAISQAVEGHLKKDFGVPPDRVALIPSGIDVRSFEGVDENTRMDLRKRYGFSDEPLIGIVARLSDVKGQDVLVSAMKTVVRDAPGAKLLLAGEGKMEGVLKDMVAAFGLEKHVFFCPVVNRTAEILAMLDIFVMPSRQEGLGLSIMEAQATGLAVVASNVGGIPTLIEDGRTGVLVQPQDPQALAGAIIHLLKDKDARARMGAAARAFIQCNHSADKMVEQTLRLYQELVRSERR